MTYIPSDNGRSWRDADKRMITYTAIPVDIPGVYRETLCQLGRMCIQARETRSSNYVHHFEELDKYERKLREEFGQQVTRPEIFPRSQVEFDKLK